MRTIALLLAIGLAACKGDIGPTGLQGPTGPQGPAGPQGPVGPGVSYQVFEGAITASPMTTVTVQTGGVFPGVVCYLNSNSTPAVWANFSLDTTDNFGCAVVEDGSGYYGSAVVDASLINAGFNVRILLFWTTG